MITVAPEKLASALPDIETLLPEQWQHTGEQSLPCDPNWPIYLSLEAREAGCLFMAREDKRAIGYAACFLHPHMNSRQVLVGTISTYFVEDRSMRALIMRDLLLNARDWLIGRGARLVYVETEYGHSAGGILERMGFVRNKIGYKMPVLDGSSAVN